MTTLKKPKETKAKKQHSCNFCGLRIPKGDTYIKSTHVYDGNIYDFKSHTWCSDIAEKLNMYETCQYDEVFTEEDFNYIIRKEYFTIMSGKFSEEDKKKYSKQIDDFKYVQFKHQLGVVIRHYKNK